jgi:hypothetical protein
VRTQSDTSLGVVPAFSYAFLSFQDPDWDVSSRPHLGKINQQHYPSSSSLSSTTTPPLKRARDKRDSYPRLRRARGRSGGPLRPSSSQPAGRARRPELLFLRPAAFGRVRLFPAGLPPQNHLVPRPEHGAPPVRRGPDPSHRREARSFRQLSRPDGWPTDNNPEPRLARFPSSRFEHRERGSSVHPPPRGKVPGPPPSANHSAARHTHSSLRGIQRRMQAFFFSPAGPPAAGLPWDAGRMQPRAVRNQAPAPAEPHPTHTTGEKWVLRVCTQFNELAKDACV